MGTAPLVEVVLAGDSLRTAEVGAIADLNRDLLETLFQQSAAESCALGFADFCAILERIGEAQNFGQPTESTPTAHQRETFFRALKLDDLVLAQACARGSELAWERFLELYRSPLTRAAIAISGNETVGCDLADALYAELYGLTSRDGERRCQLDSYKGRGSLLGWLRTTLAQRHVDHYRRSHREQPMDESLAEPAAKEPIPQPASAELATVGNAVVQALQQRDAEERFLLTAYYLDGRTLHQIGQVIGVHEATVSRKLHRLTGDLRKQVLRNLQKAGLSKRAAQEALGTDPRDLDLNLKKSLQSSQSNPFPEKAAR